MKSCYAVAVGGLVARGVYAHTGEHAICVPKVGHPHGVYYFKEQDFQAFEYQFTFECGEAWFEYLFHYNGYVGKKGTYPGLAFVASPRIRYTFDADTNDVSFELAQNPQLASVLTSMRNNLTSWLWDAMAEDSGIKHDVFFSADLLKASYVPATDKIKMKFLASDSTTMDHLDSGYDFRADYAAAASNGKYHQPSSVDHRSTILGTRALGIGADLVTSTPGIATTTKGSAQLPIGACLLVALLVIGF